MLKPYLAEIKQKGESKFLHPEPLARGKSHYIEKTRGLLCHEMLIPNLLGRHSADQQVSTKNHTVFPEPP
jgi:hypothetical protein